MPSVLGGALEINCPNLLISQRRTWTPRQRNRLVPATHAVGSRARTSPRVTEDPLALGLRVPISKGKNWARAMVINFGCTLESPRKSLMECWCLELRPQKC